LPSESRGGVLMYDVPGHYKWMDDAKLFRYYFDYVVYEQEAGK
jgi:hypothetical protein